MGRRPEIAMIFTSGSRRRSCTIASRRGITGMMMSVMTKS